MDATLFSTTVGMLLYWHVSYSEMSLVSLFLEKMSLDNLLVFSDLSSKVTKVTFSSSKVPYQSKRDCVYRRVYGKKCHLCHFEGKNKANLLCLHIDTRVTFLR
jgi:hypothetical protein